MVGGGGNPDDPIYRLTLAATPDGACALMPLAVAASENPPPGPWGVIGYDPGSNRCYWTYNGGANSLSTNVYPVPGFCPPNSTGNSSGTCSCSTGYSAGIGALTGLCVPPTNCPTNASYSAGWYDIGTDITAFPAGACVGGCQYAYDGGSATKQSLINGVRHYYAEGTYISTGQKCGNGASDPNNAPPPAPAASSPPAPTCPPGQVPGRVNDQFYCAPVGTPSPASGPADGKPEQPKDTTTCSTTTNTAGTVTTVTKTCTTNYADGSTGTSSSTTSTDSATGQSNTTTTNSGAPAKNGGAGTAGTTGPTAPGTGASGNGSGSGGGGGGSGCSSNPSAAGCGGAGGAISDLYTAKDKTFDGVLSARRDQFMASGVGQAVGGFFTVSGEGVCPQSVWHIPLINADVPFDVMCSQWALDMLAVMRVVVLICFSYFAFRVCVD